MPKSTNQKMKLLCLADVLQRESDEAHPMTVNTLISALQKQGITAERKSIYDDIETLQRYGMDIVTVRGRSNGYYLGQRPFQTPELKLLVDAVQSAKFITESKSRALIKKICALASRHEGGLMARQVHVSGRAKTFNEQSYYNVDAIQNAISGNRQISFKYFEWTVDPKAPHLYRRQWRRGGAAYRVSPWSLLWDDEYYYLLAYDEAPGIIKHYRVDKMSGISPLESTRLGRKVFEALDIADYSKSIFGMFGGQEMDVRLRFANRLIGVVVDRFGADIIILPDGEAHFTITVKAVVSPQFLAWVYGFGVDAKLLSPPQVVRQAKRQMEEIMAQYG